MSLTDDRPTVPCELCNTPTPMLGTKRCDRCWELEGRIHGDPELARRILAKYDASNRPQVPGDAMKDAHDLTIRIQNTPPLRGSHLYEAIYQALKNAEARGAKSVLIPNAKSSKGL
jgi:hypothetical protein